MRTANIKDFKGGWFYGAFKPTLCDNPNTEVGLHHYKKGFVSTPHIHRIATEFNIIVRGKIDFDDRWTMSDGDIWVTEPNEYFRIEFLEDTHLIVVKTPSVSSDKYLI